MPHRRQLLIDFDRFGIIEPPHNAVVLQLARPTSSFDAEFVNHSNNTTSSPNTKLTSEFDTDYGHSASHPPTLSGSATVESGLRR